MVKLLHLALNSRGYGETGLGLHLAGCLQQAGHQAQFLVPNPMRNLIRSAGFAYETFSSGGTHERLPGVIDAQVAAHQPDGIVLVDFMICAAVMDRSPGLKAQVANYGLPIVAIDTWDTARTGMVLDEIGRPKKDIPAWLDVLSLKLVPVPIADPQRGAAAYYSCLPPRADETRKVRRHVRRALGLGDDDRVLLFCSAVWQCAVPHEERARSQAEHVPLLLEHYLERLGSRVHLVHVGPRKFNLGSDRYHWLPTLRPNEFSQVFSAADTLLTLNASSSTIARAMMADLPAVVVGNSHMVDDVANLDRLGLTASTGFRQRLERVVPLYPFYMWPIGFHDFLDPLFARGSFRDAVTWLELLDEEGMCQSLSDLLFQPSVREGAIGRQRAYVEQVDRLPSPAGLVETVVAGGVLGQGVGLVAAGGRS